MVKWFRKGTLESGPVMENCRFEYVVEIQATPEKVWAALTREDLTCQWWTGRRMQSDWKVGAPIRHLQEQFHFDWEGVVLEFDPPRRLSYTFEPIKDNPPRFDPVEGKISRVIFTLEPKGEMVRLTLTHDQLTDEGRRLIAQGWPMGLSSLKNLLEADGPTTSQ